MDDMNVLTLTGRLTRNAETRTFPDSGNRGFVKLRLASTCNTRKNKNGEYESDTLYIDVETYVKDVPSSFLAKLEKGTPIAVSGSLLPNNWTGDDGKERIGFKLSASPSDIKSLAPRTDKNEKAAQPAQNTPAPQPAPSAPAEEEPKFIFDESGYEDDGESEDIPF